MDFNFTQEQQLLQRTLAEFGSRELAPAYASRDKDDDLPREVVSQLARMGLLAPMAEARFGGNDLDYVSIGIAHEEIARYDFNAAYVLLLSGLVGAIISSRADERQKNAILPPICRGEAVAALGVTEPSGGSDAANVKLQARRDGDSSRWPSHVKSGSITRNIRHSPSGMYAAQ